MFFLVGMSFAGPEENVAAKKRLADLVQKIRAGDALAENALLRLILGRITRMLQAALGTKNDDWKDVRQKCCLAIWRGIKDGKYDEQRASVETYATGIVSMQIKSYRRDKARHGRKTISLHLAEQERTLAYDPVMLERIGLLAREADVETEMERKERQECMRRCINELPEKQRIVVTAQCEEDEDYKTLAARLGLKNAQQVAELKRSAKIHLRKCVDKYYRS